MEERAHEKPAAHAVALRHERGGEGAPRVLALGRGRIAERILALAEEHGVPVRRDRDLVQLLAGCKLGEEIPLEVYTAVAELLTWLYRANQRLAAGPLENRESDSARG